MKYRNGFVSNSSASSFVVFKKDLNINQYHAIMNHIQYSLEHFPTIPWADKYSEWNIDDKDDRVEMWTLMDNFDMYEFLLKLHIKEEEIKSGRI